MPGEVPSDDGGSGKTRCVSKTSARTAPRCRRQNDDVRKKVADFRKADTSVEACCFRWSRRSVYAQDYTRKCEVVSYVARQFQYVRSDDKVDVPGIKEGEMKDILLFDDPQKDEFIEIFKTPPIPPIEHLRGHALVRAHTFIGPTAAD